MDSIALEEKISVVTEKNGITISVWGGVGGGRERRGEGRKNAVHLSRGCNMALCEIQRSLEHSPCQVSQC